MKKILLVLICTGNFSALAGECTMILFENGRPSAPISGSANLKKCLKGAAALLESNQSKKNPTVIVAHSDLENELYIRLRDGLIIEP